MNGTKRPQDQQADQPAAVSGTVQRVIIFELIVQAIAKQNEKSR